MKLSENFQKNISFSSNELTDWQHPQNSWDLTSPSWSWLHWWDPTWWGCCKGWSDQDHFCTLLRYSQTSWSGDSCVGCYVTVFICSWSAQSDLHRGTRDRLAVISWCTDLACGWCCSQYASSRTPRHNRLVLILNIADLSCLPLITLYRTRANYHFSTSCNLYNFDFKTLGLGVGSQSSGKILRNFE